MLLLLPATCTPAVLLFLVVWSYCTRLSVDCNDLLNIIININMFCYIYGPRGSYERSTRSFCSAVTLLLLYILLLLVLGAAVRYHTSATRGGLPFERSMEYLRSVYVGRSYLDIEFLVYKSEMSAVFTWISAASWAH